MPLLPATTGARPNAAWRKIFSPTCRKRMRPCASPGCGRFAPRGRPRGTSTACAARTGGNATSAGPAGPSSMPPARCSSTSASAAMSRRAAAPSTSCAARPCSPGRCSMPCRFPYIPKAPTGATAAATRLSNPWSRCRANTSLASVSKRSSRTGRPRPMRPSIRSCWPAAAGRSTRPRWPRRAGSGTSACTRLACATRIRASLMGWLASPWT